MQTTTSNIKKIYALYVLIIIGSLCFFNLDTKKEKRSIKAKTQATAQKNLVTFGTLIFY